ncbi:MAG: hypothetical protein HYZ34_02250 [Ignavibacteriae bacterium]|nr:hypothetical protein [Ignavibacteriota bacterium]
MNLSPKQFDQLSDILKETSAIIFGGLVVGSFLSDKPNLKLVIVGAIFYVCLVVISIYLKKFGD